MEEKIIILSPTSRDSFLERLDDLHHQVVETLIKYKSSINNLLWSRVYLSDSANQWDIFQKHPLYQEILSKGAFSHIEQPPMDNSKVTLVLSIVPMYNLQKEGTPDKMSITCNGTTYLYHSIRLTEAEAENFTAMGQTMLCFEKHIEWLSEKGLTLIDNCMRTWLYVRDIDSNYAEVMKGRNAIFEKYGLTTNTHFIASTGIEGYGSHPKSVICMDFISIQTTEDMKIKYLQAPEYLNPTYQYGVAFERGTAFHLDHHHRFFLSGTASINKEGKCIYIGDVKRQTERLLLNMDQLLKNDGASIEQMKYFVIYLRDISDYPVVYKYMNQRFPDIPKLITHAPVCRPKWLVEAEGEVDLLEK